jgi:hypothetical protein
MDFSSPRVRRRPWPRLPRRLCPRCPVHPCRLGPSCPRSVSALLPLVCSPFFFLSELTFFFFFFFFSLQPISPTRAMLPSAPISQISPFTTTFAASALLPTLRLLTSSHSPTASRSLSERRHTSVAPLVFSLPSLSSSLRLVGGKQT